MAHQSNYSLKSRRLCLNQTWVKQKGAALIFIAFILGLGAAVYMLKTYNADAARARQDGKTYKALNDAKIALIAWAVNYSSSPGQMPWPDRNGDGNYDGSSDCYIGAFDYGYLLGQLPSQPTTSPCLDPNNGLNIYSGLSTYPGLNQVFTDAQGNRLWYAVSRNLVYDYEHTENPVINPGMINPPHAITPYMRQGGTQSYPWLTVLDRSGNLVSDRVAAVIIAPGSPLENQNRTSPAPNAKEFLDSFMIGAASYKNSDSSLANEDFIMGEDSRNVPASDTTYVKPYYFNDKLAYITIDELMDALEKRVGEEVRANLKAYASLNAGSYPFAAVLGGVGPASKRSYRCTNNNLWGALPIDNPADTCTYAATATSVNSICDFKNMTSVAFRKSTAGNFTTANQACTISSTTCTCTGAGSCSVGATVFSCNDTGNCSANVAGRVRFLGAGLDATTSSPICSLGTLATCTSPANTISRTVTCNGASSLVTLGYSCTERIATLPAWFNANRWQDNVYYELKRVGDITNITVGIKNARSAVIVAGAPILNSFTAKGTPQVRPSCALNDYLDSAENVSINSIYDATSKLRMNNYNDQTLMVSP